ncbi:MAG: septum formation initiator family protein [Actinobacteria bacterium]|nr:septum formation initiator family protein [Actinomycetota bacterium]MDI6830177.1 septum formation initiator family protein [Actinomycetota bacterium]
MKERRRRVEISPRARRRRRLLMAFLLLVCLGIVALFLRAPVTRLVESRRNLAATEARLAEEEEITRTLEERRARDLTDRYVEGEARRMGYVKPGEIPVVILDTPGEAAPGIEEEKVATTPEPAQDQPPVP